MTAIYLLPTPHHFEPHSSLFAPYVSRGRRPISHHDAIRNALAFDALHSSLGYGRHSSYLEEWEPSYSRSAIRQHQRQVALERETDLARKREAHRQKTLLLQRAEAERARLLRHRQQERLLAEAFSQLLTCVFTLREDGRSDQQVTLPDAASDKPREDDAVQPDAPTKVRQDLFFYPIGSARHDDISADDISLSFDAGTRAATVSGLWSASRPTASHTSSPSQRLSSPTESHRSTPSNSARRAVRVDDVDDDGEEIVSPQDPEHHSTETTSATTISEQFQVPRGIAAEDLEAELSEEGLRIFARSA